MILRPPWFLYRHYKHLQARLIRYRQWRMVALVWVVVVSLHANPGSCHPSMIATSKPPHQYDFYAIGESRSGSNLEQQQRNHGVSSSQESEDEKLLNSVEFESLLDFGAETENQHHAIGIDDQAENQGSQEQMIRRIKRKGHIRNIQITNLDTFGRQGCDTQITLKMFDDMPVQTFETHKGSCTDGYIVPPPIGDFFLDTELNGDEGSGFGHYRLLEPDDHQDSNSDIVNTATTLTMHKQGSGEGGSLAISVNDYQNGLYFRIVGKPPNLIVTETPMEDMMEESADPESYWSRRRVEESKQTKRTNSSTAIDETTKVINPTPFKFQQLEEDTIETNRGLVDWDHDEPIIIDIMVVWTKKAECSNSDKSEIIDEVCSLTDDTEANMMAVIQLAIQETNQAFKDSAIDRTQLRLIHAYRHPTYVEQTINLDKPGELSYTALIDATYDNMGGIHEMRSKVGADMVAVIIDSEEDSCGIAWNLHSGVDKNWMYSVIHYGCAIGYCKFSPNVLCAPVIELLYVLHHENDGSDELWFALSLLLRPIRKQKIHLRMRLDTIL